jgi:hypothetical protein
MTLLPIRFIALAVSMLGYTFVTANLTYSPLAWGLLSSICGISVLLYLGALANALPQTATIIFILGIALFIAVLLQKRKNIFSKDLMILGFSGLFVAGFAIKWYGDFQFLSWDEFSHWAHVIKHMVADNALADSHSQLMAKSYPPGTAINQYFFIKTLGYSESAVLFAHVVLFIAALTAAAGALRAKPLLAMSVVFVCLSLLFLLHFNLYEILVDHILGALLGAIVAILLTGASPRRYLMIVPIIIFLPLVKLSGTLFAFIGVGCLAISVLFDYLDKNEFKHVGLISLLLSGFGVLAVHLSWHLYYKSIGAKYYEIDLNLHSMLEFFLYYSSEKHTAIWHEFWIRFTSLPLLQLCIAIILTVIFLLISTRERLRNGFILGALLFGLFVFTCSLLFSYAFYFNEYEAVRLVSFERYYGSFFFAYCIAFLPALILALVEKCKFGSLSQLSFVVVSVMVLLMQPQARTTLFHPLASRLGYDFLSALRRDSSEIASVLLKYASKNDKIYFIDQNANGFTFYLFRYDITPLAVNTIRPDITKSWCWSLGSAYSQEDIWTCDQKLEYALEGYQYLVISNADEKFWDQFGYAFDPQDRGQRRAIFAIQQEDSILRFKRVYS